MATPLVAPATANQQASDSRVNPWLIEPESKIETSAETKKPAKAGFFIARARTGNDQKSLGACTHHFDLYTAVLGATVFGLVVSNRLLFALAFGIDAVLLNALGHQISLDSF